MSVRARRSGLARLTIGPVWRNPGHAPLRRAIPLILGEAKEKGTTGESPPRQSNRGQRTIAFALSAVAPGEQSESRDHNPKTIDGARRPGPRACSRESGDRGGRPEGWSPPEGEVTRLQNQCERPESKQASGRNAMDVQTSRYPDVYARWQRDPQGFWAEAARDIDWYETPRTVFDPTAGVYGQWFTDGIVNTCWNAVDRHVMRGRAAQAALVYDSPLAGTKRVIAYERLWTEVQLLGAILRDFGVGKGDRVVIYMPMVPETVFAMLACARIGAVHSVVFGGFAARELATRIDDAKPKLILSASCGLEPGRLVAYKPLLDEAIAVAQHKPSACIILQRPQLQAMMIAGRDHDWKALWDEAVNYAKTSDCVALAATDPLYILYTSGTTGRPKGVVRDNGGHLVALKWSMQNLYGVSPGEVYWAASDIGWVVGHSYIVYAPLIHGCTTVLYEGKPVGTPDAGAFWRVVSEHRCSTLFTAPT